MEIVNDLNKLKVNIIREPMFNKFATDKAKAIIDEVMKVFRERLGRMTGPVVPSVNKHLNQGYGLAVSNGKDKIFREVDILKDKILLSRFIDNQTTNWAVSKLNQIKRL